MSLPPHHIPVQSNAKDTMEEKEDIPPHLKSLYEAYTIVPHSQLFFSKADQSDNDTTTPPPRRNLLYLGPPLDLANFTHHVPRVVAKYNEFDAQATADVLSRCCEKDEVFAKCLYRFGRESSPGLWIQLPSECDNDSAASIVKLLEEEQESLQVSELSLLRKENVKSWYTMWRTMLDDHGDETWIAMEQDPDMFRESSDELLRLAEQEHHMFIKLWWD